MHEVDYEKMEKAVTMILEAVGEDPSREGLVRYTKTGCENVRRNV